MHIKEVYEGYLRLSETRHSMSTNRNTYSPTEWINWPEPFKGWTADFFKDSEFNTQHNYEKLIDVYFKRRLINAVMDELKSWNATACEQKFLDHDYQLEDDFSGEVLCKILTTLIYESKRKALLSPSFADMCSSTYYFLFLLQDVLIARGEVCNNALNPAKQAFKCILDEHAAPQPSEVKIAQVLKSLEKQLSSLESLKGTYFGSYLSDNSDSDEEISFNAHPQPAQNIRANLLIEKVKDYRPDIQSGKRLRKESQSSPLGPRWQLDRAHLSVETMRDLDTLNQLVRAGIPVEDAVTQINTKFFVAQYRGIAYTTHKWNQPARKNHRDKYTNNEVQQPQFSASVYEAAGAYPFSRFFKLDPAEREKHQRLLREKAVELDQQLLAARNTHPVLRKTKTGSFYVHRSRAHAMQSVYTNDYDEFYNLNKNGRFGVRFLNGENPNVSTGNVPKHALEYAYGSKYYDSAKDSRLRPRWRADGRAERPYSGKVYVSLHEAKEYNRQGPIDVLELDRQGELSPDIVNNILYERETTFRSWIPGNKVVCQHIAKYPSFNGDYKQIYLSKYGLTNDLYDLFKVAITAAVPHSDESKRCKMLLANWLCAYQEVRLIDEARCAAEKKGGVLVYHNQDGTFGLQPDDTRTIACSSGEQNKAARSRKAANATFRRNLASHLVTQEVRHSFEQTGHVVQEIGQGVYEQLLAALHQIEGPEQGFLRQLLNR